MADNTPPTDEENSFKDGSNGKVKRTRPRAPLNKQTFITDLSPADAPPNNVVQREAGNVLTTPSIKKVKCNRGNLLKATGKHGRVLPELLPEQGSPQWTRLTSTTQVLTFGGSWKNRTDVVVLNKDTKENAESSEEATSELSLDADREDAINTTCHSAQVPSTSNSTTAANSSAASDCIFSSRAGATVGTTNFRPKTGFGSISSGLEGAGRLPCLPDVDLDGVDLELPASPAPSVESDFWADEESIGNIMQVLGDATPNENPKRLVYAAIDRLMGSGGKHNSGASGNVARGGDRGESVVPESLLLDDVQLRQESGFQASESCLESMRFVGSTAKLPQQLSLAGNTLANTGTTFGESANLNGKVGKIESRDTDRGNGRGESPLATPPEGDDSRSSPDSSDEADALSPSLWKLVERGDICPFEDCAFTVSAAEGREKFKSNRDSKGLFGEGKGMSIGGEKNRSRCRHFHTLCGCRHTRGAFKGLLFQTNQMDKARNHQRKHAVEAAAAAAKMSKMRSALYSGGTVEHNPSRLSHESEDNPDSSFEGVEVDHDIDADVMGNGERDGSSASTGSFGKRRVQTKGRATNNKGGSSADGRRTWTNEESDRLREIMEHEEVGGEQKKSWTWVAERIGEVGESRKTPAQCKMRWERTLNPCVKKGPWTEEEDLKLKDVAASMNYKWSQVSKVMGGRTYKQCRERFTNYLKDGLNCGPWTKEENKILLDMHGKIGNKWAEIARILKDRSENMIKNQFMKLTREKKSEVEWGQDHSHGTKGKKCGRNGANREKQSVPRSEGDPTNLGSKETGSVFEHMLPLDEGASGPSDGPYLLL